MLGILVVCKTINIMVDCLVRRNRCNLSSKVNRKAWFNSKRYLDNGSCIRREYYSTITIVYKARWVRVSLSSLVNAILNKHYTSLYHKTYEYEARWEAFL